MKRDRENRREQIGCERRKRDSKRKFVGTEIDREGVCKWKEMR